MALRWLQYSTIDLEHGVGGVEVHARALARELAKLGVEVGFSRDPRDFEARGAAGSGRAPKWDVIHTHGSAVPLSELWKKKHKAGGASNAAPSEERPIRVHTLHGSTLGRMVACREWAWPGGYLAASREMAGVRSADVVLSVHARLWLYLAVRLMGKHAVVCGNGWDSGAEPEALPPGVADKLQSFAPEFWVYIGRGNDKVKGAERVRAAFLRHSGLRLVAVPGDGFEREKGVFHTGPFSSGQVRALLALPQVKGLLLPSLYEGLPLVVLEALAAGVPVAAAAVGGVATLPAGLQGLLRVDPDRLRKRGAEALLSALTETEKFWNTPEARQDRAKINQALLPSWADVAQIALKAVRREMARRG